MTYKDQLNRKLIVNETPRRIVSLVPSQTELLVDLGLEDSIVGITKFCIHPKYLRESKTLVGGTKQINIEKIKKLKPDIILCNKEENTKDIIQALEAIAPIHISDIFNLDDCYEIITMYGELFKVQTKAQDIIASIRYERENFRRVIKKNSEQKVAYFIWKKPWMISASNTFIDYMINEAGFENVFKAEKRYPEITLDDSNLEEADVIYLSSEPYPFKEQHVSELKSLFPNKSIKIVDGEMFSWYGSRLQKSFEYFKSLHK